MTCAEWNRRTARALTNQITDRLLIRTPGWRAMDGDEGVIYYKPEACGFRRSTMIVGHAPYANPTLSAVRDTDNLYQFPPGQCRTGCPYL